MTLDLGVNLLRMTLDLGVNLLRMTLDLGVNLLRMTLLRPLILTLFLYFGLIFKKTQSWHLHVATSYCHVVIT